jgi:hypothetical protein
MSGPDQCVRLFIAAHAAWERRANARAKKARLGSAADRAAIILAESEYDELISRLCATSVVRQGISYGDNAMHDPDSESITDVSESGDSAVVRTRHIGLHNFASVYEYRLVHEAGEWRIASVLYVDEDGGYECL